MATRSQITSIARRIEALGRSEGSTHYVVVDPSETEEQALAQYERDRGLTRGGTILFIHTGVPRSPECRGGGLRW